MVWLIAQKEIRENLTSLRFFLLFALSMILVPASLYTNYQAYLTRVSDQQQIERQNRDYLDRLNLVQVFANPNFTVDIYWPPAPASVFAAGFEEAHPRHMLVGKYSVEYGAPLDVNSPAGLFGSLDYLFLIQFVFSLFAVLLSFDAITREKESGTLRSILSNPVRRAVLAGGKLVGGYLTLAVPLVASFLLGILVLAFSGMDVFAGDFSVRAAWILASSLLYVAVFFLLGLLVSCLVASTYAALMISLCFWLGGVLLLPRAATLVSQVVEPAKSRQIAWLEKLAVKGDIENEKGRVLEETQRGFTDVDGESEEARSRRWQKARGEAAGPYDERILQALDRVEADYLRRKDGQRRLGLTLARLSPAGSLVNFVTEISGTGMSAETRFLAEAERYRGLLSRELFSRIFYDTYPGGGVSMGATSRINPSELRAFRMAPASVPASLRGVDIAILLAWFLLEAGLTYAALSRYDVR